MTFDTILIVDWSAADDRGATPKKDAIWACVARGNLVGEPVYLRSRAVAEAWLFDRIEEELAAGRRVLVGFDFPFGYPAGFAERVVGRADPLAVWDYFASELPPSGGDRFALAGRLNARFAGTGPFWFNGGKAQVPGLPRKGRDREGHGMPERRLAEMHAKGAFSLWQMGGAGAVGGQAMTGMAALARLRARLPGQIAVWPFEALDRPVALVEVWPSLLADRVKADLRPDDIKDAVQVRVLARAIATLAAEGRLSDAIDAVPPAARAEEGWIFGLGVEGFGSAPLTPPRLRNDCFAMPQGVSWVPVDQALSLLRSALISVDGTETLQTARADGRVLAAPVQARRANPPAANAAVDGYGFAQSATGAGVVRLPVVSGRAAAGVPYPAAVPAGQAIRILTGALLPEGVDTVVLEEDCATDGAAVAFDGPVKRGINTRKAGEDVEAGAALFTAGRQLAPADLALLAATGVAVVTVRRRLRLAVLSTGDEIEPDPSLPAPASSTYDANRPMLLALSARWGCEAIDLGHAPDDARTIRNRLSSGAKRADLILSTGGASAGDEDHVSRILRRSGELHAWRVAMKPGRPLALGLWQGVPIMGLPGNPVAAFVCALVFARPAVLALSGAPWTEPQGFTVPAAFWKSKKAGRREYLRAKLTAEGAAEVFSSEGSGRISGLAWATGLVELPDGAAEITPGTPVRYLPYSSFGL